MTSTLHSSAAETSRHTVSGIQQLLWPPRVLHRYQPSLSLQRLPAWWPHLPQCEWLLLQWRLPDSWAAMHHTVGPRYVKTTLLAHAAREWSPSCFKMSHYHFPQEQRQLQVSAFKGLTRQETPMATAARTPKALLPNVMCGKTWRFQKKWIVVSWFKETRLFQCYRLEWNNQLIHHFIVQAIEVIIYILKCLKKKTLDLCFNMIIQYKIKVKS